MDIHMTFKLKIVDLDAAMLQVAMTRCDLCEEEHPASQVAAVDCGGHVRHGCLLCLFDRRLFLNAQAS